MTDFRPSSGSAPRPRPVTCPCCQIPRIPRHEARVRKVCAACELHHGHTGERLARQNRDHATQWAAYHAETIRQGETEIARLQETVERQRADIGALRQGLDDAKHALATGQLTEAVRTTLETERVRAADARAQSAYRSRDHLATQLWRIDALHNDSDGDGVCTCKVRVEMCDVWKQLDSERGFLYRWEAQQIDRAREGLEHSLPSEHPEYRDNRRWLA